SEVAIVTSAATPAATEPVTPETEGTAEFQWPPWDIRVKELLLKNDDIAYNVEGAAYKKGEFNPQAMDFRNLSLTGTDIFLQKGSAGGTLKGVAFRETSGLILRNSGLAFSIDEQAIDLNSLVLDLNNNRLLGELQLGYTS